jgi:uncharacterized protein (TIGR03083 family)
VTDDQVLVDKMEAVWRSIDDLCSALTEKEWKAETDCPGWSVQDQLSHLAGSESMLLGRPAPQHTIPDDLPHIRNDIGRNNEVNVDYRRSWPGAKVLEEFRDVTGERLKLMRSWTDEDFSKESWTPLGPGTVRDFIQIRIFDAWVHEQDMRRALGRPGDLSGAVAEHSFGRIAGAVPFIVGKKAGAPDGTTVVFDITGQGRVAVGVDGGRAKPLSATPADPTVRLTMDLEAFNALGCGRWPASEGMDKVAIEGDETLGRTIVEQMSFMI